MKLLSFPLGFEFFPADQRLFVFVFEFADPVLDFSRFGGAGTVKFRIGKQGFRLADFGFQFIDPDFQLFQFALFLEGQTVFGFVFRFRRSGF